MPDVYDHLRPEAAAVVPPGVYRVVGSAGDDVTVLRVTDADGVRMYSGRVRSIPREVIERSFVPAENPDTGFHPLRSLRGMVTGYYHLLGNLLRRLRR